MSKKRRKINQYKINFLFFLLIVYLIYYGALYSQDDIEDLPEFPANAKIKKLTDYVVDETYTLSKSQIRTLASILKAFEDSTSNQVVVYIIRSLEGMTIEEYAYEVATKNKIGQKGKNNGVLFLIAMNDRKMRIEVGYGLEGALPDATCKSIIENEVKPEFQNSNYYEGISKGINAIMKATKGEYKTESKTKTILKKIGSIVLDILTVIGVFVLLLIFAIIRSILGSVVFGSGSGGSGYYRSGGYSRSSGGFSGGGGSFGGGGASGSW